MPLDLTPGSRRMRPEDEADVSEQELEMVRLITAARTRKGLPEPAPDRRTEAQLIAAAHERACETADQLGIERPAPPVPATSARRAPMRRRI